MNTNTNTNFYPLNVSITVSYNHFQFKNTQILLLFSSFPILSIFAVSGAYKFCGTKRGNSDRKEIG